mgnify:CR=1 FL=1
MIRIVSVTAWRLAPAIALLVMLAGCSQLSAPSTQQAATGTQPETASPTASELPVRKIPNIPRGGEAYYAPDNRHLIAQLEDPLAQKSDDIRVPGALTYIFTDDGEYSLRITDRGQDGSAYFSPKRG